MILSNVFSPNLSDLINFVTHNLSQIQRSNHAFMSWILDWYNENTQTCFCYVLRPCLFYLLQIIMMMMMILLCLGYDIHGTQTIKRLPLFFLHWFECWWHDTYSSNHDFVMFRSWYAIMILFLHWIECWWHDTYSSNHDFVIFRSWYSLNIETI